MGTVTDVDRYVAELTTVKNDLIAAKMLISCMEQMVSGGDAKCVMDTVRTYYDADRAYVLRFAADHRTASVIHEVCREDVPPICDTAGSIVAWDSVFKDQEEKLRLVEDVDALKDDPTRRAEYEWLHRRGVHRFAAVPVFQDGLLNSFLGVDDPRANTDTPVLLQKITYIAANELRKRQLTEELHQKSYLDPMTMCYNRIAYDEALDRLCGTEIPVGVGCLNLNGLRRINESLGYRYGDRIVYKACAMLKSCFGYKTSTASVETNTWCFGPTSLMRILQRPVNSCKMNSGRRRTLPALAMLGERRRRSATLFRRPKPPCGHTKTATTRSVIKASVRPILISCEGIPGEYLCWLPPTSL